jgi:hypothetical protein
MPISVKRRKRTKAVRDPKRHRLPLSRANPMGRIKTGDIIKFHYDGRKPIGVPRGWHHDPRPTLLVFYDDGRKYWEGVNLNYVAASNIKRIVKRLKKIKSGRQLYSLMKSEEPLAVKFGYRKYFRSAAKNRLLVDKKKI